MQFKVKLVKFFSKSNEKIFFLKLFSKLIEYIYTKDEIFKKDPIQLKNNIKI